MSVGTSVLWGLSSAGNIYKLALGEQCWQHVPNQQGMVLQGFKKIIATQDSIVGLGCDQQIYIMVHKTDIPIKHQVSTFENERWIPVRGWSDKHLLPIDPPPWSSETGARPLVKGSVRLLSENWKWDGDWYVDENVGGFITDKGGWQYSKVDFHHTFTHEKKISSCVRRRKWIRNMIYAACGKWARLPALHVDPLEEPIVDIAVGGYNMPNTPQGFKAVWAVTIDGAIYFRQDVVASRPEGTSWEKVDSEEILSVSVSPSSMVWAVTWSGGLIVRTGVTWKCPMGNGWIAVDMPDNSVRFRQVSVGDSSAWVISQDYFVFFRKGVQSNLVTATEPTICGTSWMPMGHQMKRLVHGLNDQIWAIDEDQQLFFRSGINKAEPAGKTWKKLNPKPVTTDSDTDSLSSRASSMSSNRQEASLQADNSSDSNRNSSCNETINDCENNSKESVTSSKEELYSNNSVKLNSEQSLEKPPNETTAKTNVQVSLDSCDSNSAKATARFTKTTGAFSVSFVKSSSFSSIENTVEHAKNKTRTPVSECSSYSLTSDVGSEERLSMISNQSDYESLINEEPVEGDTLFWVGVSAGNCYFNKESDLQEWFTTEKRSNGQRLLRRQLSQAPWRMAIYNQLLDRNSSQCKMYNNYVLAIDRTPAHSEKQGKLKLWYDLKRKAKWVDCDINLVTENAESDIIGMLSLTHKQKKTVLNTTIALQDIICVHNGTHDVSQQEILLEVHERLGVKPRKPAIKLMTLGEDGLTEWLSALNMSCIDVHGIDRSTKKSTLWSVSKKGDVFVHHISSPDGSEPAKMFWNQEGGHMKQVETCSSGITWATSFNGTAYVHSGGYGGAFYKGLASSPHGIRSQTDIREVVLFEYQTWKPISGYSDKGLSLAGPMWRDESGKQCYKDDIKLSSRHHSWASDWTIDFTLPGKVDGEGWQYARNVFCEFHCKKGLRDYVRRRKWIRKYTVTTSGPWEEVPSLKLKDISIQSLTLEGRTCVRCWAVGLNGDAVCRMEVFAQNPKGTHWEVAPADHQFRSISISFNGSVWATAVDGSAWLRIGITHTNLIGNSWQHIAPPTKTSKLQMISAGNTVILAKDQQGVVWLRQGISDRTPEGTSWQQVAQNISQISVSASDQVWCVMRRYPSSYGLLDGVVCKLPDIKQTKVNVNTVQAGQGPNWLHICARGLP